MISSPAYGTVYLKDWLRHRDGRSYLGLRGRIEPGDAKEVLGHRTAAHESNWFVTVIGADSRMIILGCQIRAIETHSSDADNFGGTVLVV